MSELLYTDDVLRLLDRIVPRIDAGGANPIDETLHHCEYTLYQERERIHAEFRHVFANLSKPKEISEAQLARLGKFADE
jgi:hypothetical protein